MDNNHENVGNIAANPQDILYLECLSGISGDMTMGALIDLGADFKKIQEELGKLSFDHEYALVADRDSRSGISGINFDVILTHDEIHHHDNTAHQHNHEHHDEAHHHDAHSHRTYMHIKSMIENSTLNDTVKKHALSIFHVIAVAEAAVHNMPIEKVSFHEVGAVDSIIDIVGTAIALDLLGNPKVYVSELHDGQGNIRCQHGIIPVPVPAVLKMQEKSNLPMILHSEVHTEMVTPTGFAIAEGLGATYVNAPKLSIEKVGYGFGNRDTGRFPAVRAMLAKLI
ncbi:MAG: LarC family nickel insertion protein [Clostridiales Family XIII bacterium]|nr:LarC family nickel insertion protein [Clostridiales Family XIII bacterium]